MTTPFAAPAGINLGLQQMTINAGAAEFTPSGNGGGIAIMKAPPISSSQQAPSVETETGNAAPQAGGIPYSSENDSIDSALKSDQKRERLGYAQQGGGYYPQQPGQQESIDSAWQSAMCGDQRERFGLPYPQQGRGGRDGRGSAAPPTQPCPHAWQPIDSALCSAMRDPRERHGLLKLEQCLVDFMKRQDEEYMDVGGSFNSIVVRSTAVTIPSFARPQTTFQRCILHRLCDRFGITRATQESGFIRLLKQPNSQIPTKLLVNASPTEYGGDSPTEGPTVANGSLTQTHPTIAGGNKRPGKMKIMKRASSNVSSHSDGSARGNSRKNKPLEREEREKKYAEARARIFQTEQDSAGAMNAATTGGNNESETMAQHEQYDQPPQQNVYDPNMKARFRNRQQEANDPDFRRAASNQAIGYGYGIEAAPMPVAPVPWYASGAGRGRPGQVRPHTEPIGASYVGAPYHGQQQHSQQFYPQQPFYPPGASMAAGRGRQPPQYRSTTKGPAVHNHEEFPSLR